MFDAQVAPAFVKCYYEHYLTNPAQLESMYTLNATFSHADIQAFTPGATHASVSGHIKGIDEIRNMLNKLQSRIVSTTGSPSMKVCFAHVDAVPSGNQTMTVLVGGYFLYPDGASRFVHNFVLQSSSIRNNYLIVTDVLRIYSKQGADASDAKSVAKRTEPAAAHRNQAADAQRGTQHAKAAPKEHAGNNVSSAPSAHAARAEPTAVPAPAPAPAAASAGAKADAQPKPVAEEPKAKATSHAHQVPASRSWCDLMDEADEIPPHDKAHSNDEQRQAKADIAKKPVSSYAAAVRQASATNVQKPAQKIGGIAAVPVAASSGDDSEARGGNAGGAARGERNANNREDNHENKRVRGGFTGGAHEGKSHEGKSTFIKYCAILKNLPLNCSDEEIINLLAPHVKVTAVRNGTSQGRTYAFVKFDDEKMVPVIQESGLTLRGASVDIEKVVEKYAHQRKNNTNGEQGNVANRYPAREGEGGNTLFNNRKSTPNTRGATYNRSNDNNNGNAAAASNTTKGNGDDRKAH